MITEQEKIGMINGVIVSKLKLISEYNAKGMSDCIEIELAAIQDYLNCQANVINSILPNKTF